MNILRTKTENVSTVRVSGVAELCDAGTLKAALIESLDTHRPTVLDLSALDRPDVATLQLICSAIRSFGEAAVPLSIAGSGTFQSISRDAGFSVFGNSPEEPIGEKEI